MNQTENEKNSLDKNVTFRWLLKFSLPTIISLLFMSVYMMVDGVFVSNFIGEDGLAAVNIVMPIIMIGIAIGNMFGMGGSALTARLLGEGKNKEAKQIFTLIIIVAFLASVAMSVLCLIFLEPLLKLLGANNQLIEACSDYAVPMLAILPFTFFGVIFQMAFITVGKSHFALIGSFIGGMSNVILDYLFMKVLNWGIAGAAVATGIGFSIPAVLGLLYFSFCRKGSLYLVKPKLDFKSLGKCCGNGASEMVTALSSSIVTLLFNNILMRMVGTVGVSAMSIIMYTQGILTAIYLGYSSGIAPIISYNYGKLDSDRLKKIYKISLRAILAASVLVFTLSMGFSSFLVRIFTTHGSQLYNMAVVGFRIYCISLLFMGFNTFSSAMFTALSNGGASAILSIFRTLIFIVVFVIVLPLIFGLTGVWIALPLAELMGIIMTIWFFKKYKKVYNYA